jgi:hypothetical protein
VILESLFIDDNFLIEEFYVKINDKYLMNNFVVEEFLNFGF